jgi:hypothetical protein
LIFDGALTTRKPASPEDDFIMNEEGRTIE